MLRDEAFSLAKPSLNTGLSVGEWIEGTKKTEPVVSSMTEKDMGHL